MNTIAEIQKQIMELKKEKDFCILAHCYQSQEILEVADIVVKRQWKYRSRTF